MSSTPLQQYFHRVSKTTKKFTRLGYARNTSLASAAFGFGIAFSNKRRSDELEALVHVSNKEKIKISKEVIVEEVMKKMDLILLEVNKEKVKEEVVKKDEPSLEIEVGLSFKF